MQKSFDLATMISIISGKLFTSWENLNSALNFLTGESLYTHQIPRAANVASKHILKSYPELEDIGKDEISFVQSKEVIMKEKLLLVALLKFLVTNLF